MVVWGSKILPKIFPISKKKGNEAYIGGTLWDVQGPI